MTTWRNIAVCAALVLLLAGCATTTKHPPTLSDAPDTAEAPFDWKSNVADVLGVTGTAHHSEPVYSVTIPRSDVLLVIDGMAVPTGAGIASTFHFYLCPCGKMNVIGDFTCIDYEANDVIDALRPRNLIRVASISPIAIGTKPNLVSVRFQGEGEAKELAALIKEAMRWTGEARMKPAK